jgi:transcription elongation factor Elf1
MKFDCPNCSQPFVVDESYAGQTCNCPSCGELVAIPAQEVTLDTQIAELTSYKKRWDKVEKELKELRDSLQVQGRINQKDKAMMILHIESGHNLLHAIQQHYPQYLCERSSSIQSTQTKGCLSVILLTVIPLASIAGWFISRL